MKILIMVGVVIIAGLGYFVWQGSSESPDSAEQVSVVGTTEEPTSSRSTEPVGQVGPAEKPQSLESTGEISGVGTAPELKLLNRNLECTITIGGGQATMYVAGSQIRFDAVSSNKGRATRTSFIDSNNVMYYWNDLSSEGIKYLNPPPSTDTFSYTCKPWVVDSSKFVSPTNITFKTY